MSKIGRVNLELQEQANELGFSTTQDALDAGYGVDYDNAKLVKPEEAAHEAWLGEKSACLAGLVEASAYASRSDDYFAIKRAIKFIEGAKHE